MNERASRLLQELVEFVRGAGSRRCQSFVVRDPRRPFDPDDDDFYDVSRCVLLESHAGDCCVGRVDDVAWVRTNVPLAGELIDHLQAEIEEAVRCRPPRYTIHYDGPVVLEPEHIREIYERLGRLERGEGLMATAAELRLLDHRETAWVLVVEGFPVAWTDHEDLVGSDLFDDGVSFTDAREVLPGLIPPDWSLSIDHQADWMPTRSHPTIELEDLEGRLSALFGLPTGAEPSLVFSVEPTDDLAARTELHDRHVGNEYVGPSGERDYYPLSPGFTRPRLHVGEVVARSDAAATPVSEDPVILEGRRFALYRLWRDHVTYPDKSTGFASWRPMAEADRPLWGTVRLAQHDVDSRRWSINCDGPESLLYRRLGTLSEWSGRHAQPETTFLEIEDDVTEGRVEISITTEDTDGSLEAYGADVYTYSGPLTPLDVRLAVAGYIADAAAIDPGSGAFEDIAGQFVRMNLDGSIEIATPDGGAPSIRAELEVLTSEKMWLALGYGYGQREVDDDLFVDFYQQDDDPSGFFRGRFTTRAPGAAFADWDNGGQPRVFKPLYKTGAFAIPADLSRAPVIVRLGFDQVAHTGQLDRPVASDPDDAASPIDVDGSDADTQGLWLLWGARRLAGQEESFTEFQVARCAWRASAALAGVGGDPPTIRLVRWEDPKAFGIDRPKLSTPWVAVVNDPETGIQARPLLRLGFGHADQDGEDAHVLLQRLFCTTGTSGGWDGYADEGPSLPATSNEPAGAPARLDAEIEDLGLSLPKDWVAPPEVWEQLTHVLEDGPLRKAGVAFFPGQESEEVIRSIMATRGWALGYADGRYTPFAPDQPITPGTAVALTGTSKRTDDRLSLHRIKQQVRALAPKDKYVLTWNRDPFTESLAGKLELPDPTPGARYRQTRMNRGRGAGGRKHASTEHLVVSPFQRLPGAWVQRSRDVASWTARGHCWLLGYPLMPPEADVIFPGTPVIVTDPLHLDPVNNTYGLIGASGIVMRLNVKEGMRQVSCDILVDTSSLGENRYHAPSARGRGFDPTTRRIYVHDDWLDAGGPLLDCEGFVEPSGSVLGGDARLKVVQFDGDVWTERMTGVVQDVDATPGSSSIRVEEGYAGAYRRDDEAVVLLQAFTLQDAPWVLAFFAPVSDQDGAWSGGTVVPWR